MELDDRKMSRISMRELERRWKLVREHMKERGLDAMVLQNAKDFTGGYVKWFTDIPAGYPRTVVFHVSDLMTVVEHGPEGKLRELGGADREHPGVGEILTTAAFPSVNYTQRIDAEAVSSVLLRRGYRRVAFLAADAMPYGFVTHVERALSGTATISDETDFIDRVKAIKSPEEIGLIKKTAEMQDAVFGKVVSRVKPGMRDSDVTALAEYEGHLLGSEQGIFLGMSAKLGAPAFFAQRHFQGRTLSTGNYMPLLIENNGVGGFYAELARIIVLGKASQELAEGFEIVKEAQEHTVRKFKHGASCREISLAHNEFMKRKGAAPETRLYSHSQGYDLVERPLIRADENMILEENMNMAVHPAYATNSLFTVICDNYLVERNGAGDCLHKTPKKIFEIQ
jgi:Xaa-Pro aminopeptidase